jgi:hypothetical protein
MTTHKGGEGGIVPLLDEAPKQLPIGHPGLIPQKHRPAKVPDDLAHLTCRHAPTFAGVAARPLHIYLPHDGRLIHDSP